VSLAVYLVLAMVAVVAVGPVVRRPARTILPLYAASIPVGSVFTLGVPLPSPFNTLSSALGAIAVFACVAHVLRYGRGRIASYPVVLWMAFLAWSLITVLWAIDPRHALSTGFIAASLVFLMVAVAVLRTDGADLDAMRVALIASGIAVGGYALLLILGGQQLPWHGVDQRLAFGTGSDTHPNILAAALMAPLILSVERILIGGTRWMGARGWRLLGTAGAFFSFVAIVLTGSRGGVLSAVIAFVICLIHCRKLQSAKVMIRRLTTAVVTVALGLVVSVAVGLAVDPNGTVHRILQSDAIHRLTNAGGGGSGRLDIWTAGILACETHCAWGAGLDNFPQTYNQVFALSAATHDVGTSRAAHDIYLQAAVEVGFLGLTLLLLAAIAEWKALSRIALQRVGPSSRAILAGVLLANVFLSAMWFKYFWLVLILFRLTEGAALEGARSSAARTSPPFEQSLVAGAPAGGVAGG
jgi:O-antigen ligase